MHELKPSPDSPHSVIYIYVTLVGGDQAETQNMRLRPGGLHFKKERQTIFRNT